MINVAAGIILKGNKVLVAKRPNDKHQGGLWEFPGGKMEKDESPFQALVRELKEELGIRIKDARPLKDLNYQYSDKKVRLFFFTINSFEGQAKGLEGQQIQWVELQKLHLLEFPAANQVIVNLLQHGNY